LGVYEEDIYIEVGEGAGHAQEVLAVRGFVAQRHEHHYVIPTHLSTAARAAPAGFVFVSAADCDVDRLRELDDALRQDVPAPRVGAMIRPGVQIRRSETQSSTRLPTSSRSIAARANTWVWLACGPGRKSRGSA
jgi:hypothetical protein